MTWPVPFDTNRIDLHTPGRIDKADADRQMATAREILERLERQPGLVLADEVGMGKTFVALAVAVSAVWADKGRRPVVVMVPPSLEDKWPRDLGVFRKVCLRRKKDGADLRIAQARTGLELFKIFDDPLAKRANIIFLTHGGLFRNLTDPWMKLAIVKYALHGARLGERRAALPEFIPDILRARTKFGNPQLFERLFSTDVVGWRSILSDYGEDPGDDPIPEAIRRVLEKGETDLRPLRESLLAHLAVDGSAITDDSTVTRCLLNAVFQDVWRDALRQAHFRSPLLILDEAHHLKNPATKLASLFISDEANQEVKLLEGALEGGFERMLFLTATPFQLGHHELLNVIDRFAGIGWRQVGRGITREGFVQAKHGLEQALDEAQLAATGLDAAWRSVTRDDLRCDGNLVDVDTWWKMVVLAPEQQPERIQVVRRAYVRAQEALGVAGSKLQPWVIRHLRLRTLPGRTTPRRVRFSGAGIRTLDATESRGLAITDTALLPFLLAARTQAIAARATEDGKQYRATFAEGLASSYEAFLETRKQQNGDIVDEEDTPTSANGDPRLRRCLARLQKALPSEDAYADHPKMAALVERVSALWTEGEKVVVFCHFRATGRAIEKHLASALWRKLRVDAAQRMGCTESAAMRRLRLAGKAFDEGRPLYRILKGEVHELLSAVTLTDRERKQILDVVRRFVRTPLFLARYLDLGIDDRELAFRDALGREDGSGVSLRNKLREFVHFIATRCEEDERREYLDALQHIHLGTQREGDDAEDSAGSTVEILPNIRLANGGVHKETRKRLLLAFNTPFFPEILVASSVMAEGVDLHLNCRYLIHHDLSWNPSTIEQRTGRVDRIGAKAERVGKSIQVFMPYVAATQDEKMYRVVCDRERWFQIVMGEEYRTDEASTDSLESRVPLPEAAASELSYRLEVSSPDVELVTAKVA